MGILFLYLLCENYEWLIAFSKKSMVILDKIVYVLYF